MLKLSLEEKKEKLYESLCRNIKNQASRNRTPLRDLVSNTNRTIEHLGLPSQEAAKIIKKVIHDNQQFFGRNIAIYQYINALHTKQKELHIFQEDQGKVESCNDIIDELSLARKTFEEKAFAISTLENHRGKKLFSKIKLIKDQKLDAEKLIELLNKKLKTFSPQQISEAEELKKIENSIEKKNNILGKKENRPSQDFSHYKESGIYNYDAKLFNPETQEWEDHAPRKSGRRKGKTKTSNKITSARSTVIRDNSDLHHIDPRTESSSDSKSFKVAFKNSDLKAARDEIVRQSNKLNIPLTAGIKDSKKDISKELLKHNDLIDILIIRKNLSSIIMNNFESPSHIKSNKLAQLAKVLTFGYRKTDADLAKTIIENYKESTSAPLSGTGFKPPKKNRGR